MEHEPAAQPPFPAVKNQRRFPVLWMAVMFGLMLINSGCVSYHVSSNGKRPDARLYALITQQLKRDTSGYRGRGLAQIGANENGITTIEALYCKSYGGYSETFARPRTRKWDEIQDVKVRGYFGFILMGGLIDPTAGSSVDIKFCDGQNMNIMVVQRPEILGIVPFWLFSTHWGKAHQTAVAIQNEVAWHKQNAGTTTLKNP